MQEWEYLTIDTQNSFQTNFTVVGESQSDPFEGREISECLPELGKYGWELICSHKLEATLFGVGQRFYFKRPLE
ncbi:MAG TPA: hypothetical protein VFI24_26540 [Pyrinomonadaceae bacterium]|nr:hypothetical protein [Pyrinomonadaceae bacterium]